MTVRTAAAESLRRAARTAARRPGLAPLQLLTDTSHALADPLRHDMVARAGSRPADDEACRTHLDLDLSREWWACVHRQLTEAARAELLAEGTSRATPPPPSSRPPPASKSSAAPTRSGVCRPALTRFWELVLPRPATPETLVTLSRGGTRWTAPAAPVREFG